MVGFELIFAALLPVFLTMGIGLFLRWRDIISEQGERSLMRLVIYLLFPCLTFKFVLGNELLKSPAIAFEAVLTGFFSILIGCMIAFWLAPVFGIREPVIRRSFGVATGMHNFGYIALPIAYLLVDANVIGVLLVLNTGIDLAIWTVGVMMLSGKMDRTGLKRALNPPVVALIIATTLNFLNLEVYVPEFLTRTFAMLGPCAVPIGLIMTGSTFFGLTGWLSRETPRITLSSLLLRIGLIPITFLLLAKVLPLSDAVKSVIAIHAAMPAAVIPVALSKYFGGSTLTVIQCVVPSCIVGLISIPLWIQFGFNFLGLN